jgi:NADH-quinone oxidoreductase subunit E
LGGKSNREDETMSIFPMPDYKVPDAADLAKLSKDFALPKDMAAAAALMTNPLAATMALSAIAFGFASQALGIWAGAVAGTAQASQRLLAPLAPKGVAPRPNAAPVTVAGPTRPKPELKVVAKLEPAPKPEPVKKAEPAPKVTAKAIPAAKVATRAEPAETVDAKGEPVRKLVAKAEPAKPVVARAQPPEAAAAVAAAKPEPAAVTREAATLMPEDFHKPRALDRPATPDDLKAISGIGPKLEKVLNDLGVWTYAQIAGWGAEEIAWVDDYLSFSGRIGRDKWIEQAGKLAAASAKPAKG